MNRDMLIHIVQTEHYIIDVDPRKNRIYAHVQEGAGERPEPSQFLEQLHDVKHHLSNGFTMLVELCKQRMTQQDDSALIHDVMDLLFEGGVRKIADVCPESVIRQGSQDRDSEQMRKGVQYRGFISREAAEAWLDTI